MAVIIDPSLIKFNDEVSPAMSGMTAEVSSLVSKISNIVSINNATKSAVESSYKSVNQLEIYGKFTEINSHYNSIQSFISSSLNQILSSSSTLITMIGSLIKYKEAVDLAEIALNNAKSKPKKNYPTDASSSERSEIASYNASIDEEIRKSQEAYDKALDVFNKAHEEALAFFNKLKGTDPAISTNATAATSSQLTSGHGGTFTRANYNGMGYYIYIPEGADLTRNLPVTLFLHGKGENSIGKVTKNSLPSLLNSGLQTDGIVICPVSKTGDWTNSEREKAKALTDSIIQEYSADTSRVSLAGYSNGAIASYSLAAKYDDYFSCVVPIAGEYWLSEGGIENLTHTKIWAFHGNKDVSFTMEEVTPKWQKIVDAGGEFDASVYDAGHGGKEQIMTMVFSEKVSSDKYTNGQDVSLIEWMQQQSRNNI